MGACGYCLILKISTVAHVRVVSVYLLEGALSFAQVEMIALQLLVTPLSAIPDF